MLTVVVLLVAGCSSDDYVRRDHAPRAAETYQADLDACRSAAAADRAGGTAAGFLAGALIGAANGAVAGAHGGGADVGAAIGAGVGAVIGFAQGLAWSGGSSVDSCMHRKGYRRA